ncbi:MAG: hypothetical protein ACI87N_002391 [Flavobacteriales bacterium]|jgi:hypothetical protein
MATLFIVTVPNNNPAGREFPWAQPPIPNPLYCSERSMFKYIRAICKSSGENLSKYPKNDNSEQDVYRIMYLMAYFIYLSWHTDAYTNKYIKRHTHGSLGNIKKNKKNEEESNLHSIHISENSD